MADTTEKLVHRLADCFEAEYADSGVDIDMDRAVKMLDEWRDQQLQPLRARVAAEMEQAHAEQVAEREHMEEGARLCMLAWPLLDAPIFEDEREAFALFFDAERARQAKGDKREVSE